MSSNHTHGFDPKTASHEEWMIELYGEEKGKRIVNHQDKVDSIMNEAKALVEKRWKEEFPEDDCSGNTKPWGFAWFSARPPY